MRLIRISISLCFFALFTSIGLYTNQVAAVLQEGEGGCQPVCAFKNKSVEYKLKMQKRKEEKERLRQERARKKAVKEARRKKKKEERIKKQEANLRMCEAKIDSFHNSGQACGRKARRDLKHQIAKSKKIKQEWEKRQQEFLLTVNNEN